VDATGDTLVDPFVGTAPIPSMETTLAFVVRQVRVAEPPRGILSGLAEIEADWSVAGADSAGADGAGEE
jgi:hypothetical protein